MAAAGIQKTAGRRRQAERQNRATNGGDPGGNAAYAAALAGRQTARRRSRWQKTCGNCKTAERQNGGSRHPSERRENQGGAGGNLRVKTAGAGAGSRNKRAGGVSKRCRHSGKRQNPTRNEICATEAERQVSRNQAAADKAAESRQNAEGRRGR